MPPAPGPPAHQSYGDSDDGDDERSSLLHKPGDPSMDVASSKAGGRKGAAGEGPTGGSRRPSFTQIAKWAAVAAAVVAVMAGLKYLISNPALIQAVLDGAHNHPAIVIPIFMLANFFVPLLLLPSAPFQLLAGAIWGIPLALLISGTVTFASNVAAFVLGRNFIRERLTAYLTANVPTFPAVQAAILAEGWTLVLMLRLSPVLPDSLMNYALSLTNISLRLFCVATAIAMVPWCLLYMYLGSASKDIVATLSGGGSSGGDDSGGGGPGWAVGAVSMVMAAGAVLYLGRVIKKAVDKAAAAAAP